ncbi:protocadherin-10-like protein [Lasius niger]|uniref:Protocadherin-10-like protein n=1 Tax=Lasius niger TaxID=67767 RepID=A0A0J7K320_LASNI|nr:protocadherin-10-like protein [Lasius niger]
MCAIGTIPPRTPQPGTGSRRRPTAKKHLGQEQVVRDARQPRTPWLGTRSRRRPTTKKHLGQEQVVENTSARKLESRIVSG